MLKNLKISRKGWLQGPEITYNKVKMGVEN